MIYEYSEYDLVISCRASQAISTRPKVSIFGFARMPARNSNRESPTIASIGLNYWLNSANELDLLLIF